VLLRVCVGVGAVMWYGGALRWGRAVLRPARKLGGAPYGARQKYREKGFAATVVRAPRPVVDV